LLSLQEIGVVLSVVTDVNDLFLIPMIVKQKQMIQIEKGRIFVQGKETVDPLLIGYAVLDAVENNEPIGAVQSINPANLPVEYFVMNSAPAIKLQLGEFYTHGDIVYLKHDIEQLPRMVVEIRLRKDETIFDVQSGTEISSHSAFEMSKEKTVY